MLHVVADFWASFGGKIALSSAWFACSVIAWRAWPQRARTLVQALLLALLALLARATAWPLPASDDVHRYVWEGQLILDGASPYATTADDPIYAQRQDENWQAMNHKDARTAYPPLALILCALIAKLSPSVAAFKLAASLADVATIGILTLGLGANRLRWAALYALNPLPLISYTGEGHFDAFMVLAMSAAIVFLARPHIAWTALAIAIDIKILALLLLPVLWMKTAREKRLGAVLTLAIAIALPLLPFIHTLPNFLKGLTSFATTTSGNATVHWLLELATGSKPAATLLCGAALLGCMLTIHRCDGHAPTIARRHFTALLILAPTVTYWYPGWALPFAALAPSPALWVLSATDIFYYAAAEHQAQHGWWWHPRWAWSLQWLPFIATLIYQRTRPAHREKRVSAQEG